MPPKSDKPVSSKLDEPETLERLYEEVQAKHEGWAKLFDESFRESVLDDIHGWGADAMAALDCYEREVGDLTGTAANLRVTITGGDRADVELAWFRFLADRQNHGPATATMNEFIERAQAIQGGELSGETRKRKREDGLSKAGEALNRLLDQNPMSDDADWSLEDIQEESGISGVTLRNLKLWKIRKKAASLRKN